MRDFTSYLVSVCRGLLNGIVTRPLVLFSIAFPISVRAIPEVLAGAYPLGFDTVWVYAPFVKAVQTEGFGSVMNEMSYEMSSFRPAPLMFMFLGIAGVLSSAEPFLITKAAAPLLHAFLVFSLYYFARCRLHWDDKRCLLIILLSSLYFVPLRFSWDMYKNTLGYALLILALAHLQRNPTSRDRFLFSSLAGLSILASELTTVLLGAIAGLVFLQDVIKHRKWNSQLLVVGLVALLATFIYLGLLFSAPPTATPLAPVPPRTSLLYNYVGAAEDIYIFPGLGDMYTTVLLLSGIILAPLLPFAWFGFRRERRLWIWTLALGIGAFSLVVVPFAAIPSWHRWLFMLTFPVIIFAVSGLARFGWKVITAFLVVLVVLSASFMVLSPASALPYYTNGYTIFYIPSSMMQNTVPLQDSLDIVDALWWLNEMRFEDSVLVAHISFVGWAKLYSTIPEIYGFVDPAQVDGGNFSAYEHVFLVYWTVGQGWFKSSLLPAGMVKIHTSANIAVYELSRPS